MNSSLVRRWRNADAIILAAVYGKRANTVLSRPARRPVAYANARPQAGGIPIPAGVWLRFSSLSGFVQSPRFPCNFVEQERMPAVVCLPAPPLNCFKK
jgi:hypothetical protein